MGRRRVAAVAVACLIGSALVSQASAPAVELKEATMPGTADVVQSPANKGFWTVDVGGDVEARDGASNYGTLRNHQLSHPIVGMSPTQSGKGYWLAGTDGGVFAFGDARFFGSTGGTRLNQPVVGIASTPSGNGYWLAASDGGVFSFGDARFFGSTGGLRLNQPIMGIASTPTGLGYWLVGADGGIFAVRRRGVPRLDRGAPAQPAGRRHGEHAYRPRLLAARERRRVVRLRRRGVPRFDGGHESRSRNSPRVGILGGISHPAADRRGCGVR